MTRSVLEWYANIGAKYLDLVGDYAGKEKFFIECDSLLLQCFSDPLLDFGPGFQLLHAVYNVEKYLQNLSKRGCNFDIMFFHTHQDTCVPPGAKSSQRYLLARMIIIDHLQRRTDKSGHEVFTFGDLNDPDFARYLQSSACYFALCSDGADYKYKSKTLHLQSNEVTTRDDNGDAQESREQLRSIIKD